MGLFSLLFAFSGTLCGQNGYNLMVVSWVENEYLFDGEYNEVYINCTNLGYIN